MYLFPYGSEGRNIYQWVGKLFVTFQLCAQKGIILLLIDWLVNRAPPSVVSCAQGRGWHPSFCRTCSTPFFSSSDLWQLLFFQYRNIINSEILESVLQDRLNFKSQIAFLHLSNPPIFLSLFSRGLLNSAVFPQALPVTYL